MVAYALYCVTPLNKINPSNAAIQQISAIIPHSVGSIVMRMLNFRYIDPVVNQKKQTGFGHVAKADKQIFEEFKNDWGNLSVMAENITGLALFDADPLNGAKPISSLTDHRRVSRERHFFRQSVFAAYDSHCCITGVALPGLLVASHIKPYSKCRATSERIAPTNGLLLNTFYDKAFDSGLITITPNYKIFVSDIVKAQSHNEFTRQWLVDIEGNQIIRPQRFWPDKTCLEYHNDVVFRR